MQTVREGQPFTLTGLENNAPLSWRVTLASVRCGSGAIFSPAVLAAGAASTGQQPSVPRAQPGMKFCLVKFAVTNEGNSDQPWMASGGTVNVGQRAYADNEELTDNGEGDAVGEVFNGEGKTDILIRVEDRNIFIGECKIWGGPSTMDEALGQIFKYLVWRDTKAAILLFIRNKDVTAVIKKAVAKIEAHPNYKRRGPSHTDDRARFRHACPRRRRAGDPPGVAALRVADHYERSDSLGPPRGFHADYTTSARSAALIMFFAFGGLSTGPETDLKVAATAFGAGILLDATVVRGLLVPASVAVFGNWNWWLPAWGRRLLRLLALPPTGPAMTGRAFAGTGHGR